MASFLDKFKLNTALTDNTKLDLSCQHITTADWMQFSPVYVKEMVPGEKISVQLETFTRLQPLVVPTLGRMNVNNRAFFVPYRTIFKAWTDFITDTEHAFADGETRIVNNVPFITNAAIVEAFTASSSGLTRTAVSATVDIMTYNAQGLSGSYVLTRKGRQALKFLNSLGYEIMWIDNEQDYSATYSALPILAAAKVWYDWYAPAQYLNNQQITNLLQLLSRDNLQDFDTGINAQTLVSVFDVLLSVLYDSDPFVSAWDNPTAPANGNYTAVQLSDISMAAASNATNQSIVANGLAGGSPYVAGVVPSTGATSASPYRFTQYMIDTLKSLTDYMKRHQLVGARALDRYLARFGKQLTAEKLQRCNYIGTQKVPVQIGDVMNQADTTTGTLGDFAGKGVGYGVDKPFEFSTDEYGLFIVISSVVPAIGYYQGKDKQLVGHINRFDFYTPEFDSLGTQAIAKSELYIPSFVADDATGDEWCDNAQAKYDQSIFGFTPRYSEYKYGRDKVSGDFRVPSLNPSGTSATAGAGSASWHLMRYLSYDTPSDVVHNYQFVKSADAASYDRIFANTSTSADHFTMIYNINVASWSPMKPLFETYDFEDKGKVVNVDANGVKMN